MDRSCEASPLLQIGDYVSYFAGRLIDASPGTDAHVASWRNYMFSIEAAATEAAGSPEKVTSHMLNTLFGDELALAALARGTSSPEAATMKLDIHEWRKRWRIMLDDLHVPGDCPQTPLDFLGALAAGEITYKSVRTR